MRPFGLLANNSVRDEAPGPKEHVATVRNSAVSFVGEWGANTLAVVAEPVTRLLEHLDLEQQAVDEHGATFRGHTGNVSKNMQNRLFGGLVVAQTIMAAGRTHPIREINSVQQFFLRGGRTDQPIRYRVEMLFVGRTFASARVEAHQEDDIISHANVGFNSTVEGPDRHDPVPPRPAIETTVNRDELRQRPGWQDQPVEMRIDPSTHGNGEPEMATWLRPAGPMPEDPLLHKAVLGYASDRGLMSVGWHPHGPRGSMVGASLDHAIWFHRPVLLDRWHSYLMHSPTLAGGRSLNHGVIHDEAGTLIASTAQQASIRARRTEK